MKNLKIEMAHSKLYRKLRWIHTFGQSQFNEQMNFSPIFKYILPPFSTVTMLNIFMNWLETHFYWQLDSTTTEVSSLEHACQSIEYKCSVKA